LNGADLQIPDIWVYLYSSENLIRIREVCYNIKGAVKVSDQDLIYQLLSSDKGIADKAWQHVYRSYYPVIKALVLKSRGTEQDAIDVFQDTLIVLDKNIRAGIFKGDSTLKTYIYSIGRNLWLKEYRLRQKKSYLEGPEYETASEDIAYIQYADMVLGLMEQLREDCRKILNEYYYNNRSMAELQEMFALNSIQATKNKKWRCLGYLVKLLQEKSGFPVKLVGK
jgi:RNA polymerase sigma factor (sigma-70 family)